MKKYLLAIAAMLTPTVLLAAEDGVDVIPDEWHLWIWTLLTFLVMFALLAKLAFKPIAEALDRRSQTIKQSLDEAESARAEAKRSMEEYSKQLADARNQAKKIIDEGKSLGETVRKEVVDKAATEAQAIMQRAQEEIVREKEKSLQELRDTVANLSVLIAGKVIERQVDAATHRQLIESMINDLSKVRKV